MTKIKTNADERRTHRIATYLSDTEYQLLKQKFEQSDFDNFSQYHRELLLDATSNKSFAFTIPAVNEDICKSLTRTVHALSRFIAQLEMFQLIYQKSSNADIQGKIDSTLNEVRRIAGLCYTIVGWYRQNNRDEKAIIIDIASLTLTSTELYQLADDVRDAEARL
ncbi:hypothetical protein D210916BOD24_11020 [Alteromonas sp. D210916BOD_24]|uniref:hypothetical protein n=1 Tax=Alteromonas sp. D210916BOD_24 TaxID=3157618 RepID=UPI00399D0E7B